MGNSVIRKGVDLSTGHSPCFPPVPAIQASSNVFANKIGVVRNGDSYRIHCCGPSCHVGKATGSSTVFANKKGITTRGRPITCGDTSSNGSSNVRAG